MGKHLDEKSLMVMNEKSIFYRIKSFFIKLFTGKNTSENEPQIENIKTNEIQSNIKQKDNFIGIIRNIENNETKLLKLQKQYEDGFVEGKDLPKDQIKALINLYKKQISELNKSNEKRKEKLLLYRNKMQNT